MGGYESLVFDLLKGADAMVLRTQDPVPAFMSELQVCTRHVAAARSVDGTTLFPMYLDGDEPRLPTGEWEVVEGLPTCHAHIPEVATPAPSQLSTQRGGTPTPPQSQSQSQHSQQPATQSQPLSQLPVGWTAAIAANFGEVRAGIALF